MHRMLCAICNTEDPLSDIRATKLYLVHSSRIRSHLTLLLLGLTLIGGPCPKVWVGFEIQDGVSSIGHLSKVRSMKMLGYSILPSAPLGLPLISLTSALSIKSTLDLWIMMN